MKVEYSSERKDIKRPQRKRKRRKIKVRFFLFLLFLIMGALATLSLTVWFRVETVDVHSDGTYSDSEIIEASGIVIGDNIPRISADDAALSVETMLPYVEKAEIIKKYPHKMLIKTTKAEKYAVLYSEQGYNVVSADFKVLSVMDEKPEGLIRIIGACGKNTVIGEKYLFSDKEQQTVLNDLTKKLAEKSVSITQIDVANLLDISFVIEDRLYVKFGGYSKMDEKLTHLSTVLNTLGSSDTGILRMSEWDESAKESVISYGNIDEYLK